MRRLNEIILLVLGLLLVFWSFQTVLQKSAPAKYQNVGSSASDITTNTLRVGDFVLPIEVAQTPEARAQGFSGREEPLSGHGMLFIFDRPDFYGFWMKEMKFALDIIWIDENWQVLGVERGVLPESFPKSFYPPSPAKYALELRAGDANYFNIDVGTKLYFNQ